MLQNIDKVIFLVGNSDIIKQMKVTPALKPFSDDMVEFLNEVSKKIMSDPRSRAYSDVVSLGFWLRKASILNLKTRYGKDDSDIHLGKGIAFHIAPSNVPVNFAYSLATGLMTGNANIVRVPSKDFEQVDIIAEAINKAFEAEPRFKPYIALVRYGRDNEINDMFSEIADVRIIWGGDTTVGEIRKSPMQPRATEITFADRYSLAIIDSDEYLAIDNKGAVASDFYNDTYLTDQNACTSPRFVIWMGTKREEAKELFWAELHKIVNKKYQFQAIQGVNKLTTSYMAAASGLGVKLLGHEDNLLIRVEITELSHGLTDYIQNSGFFYEYDCDDILSIKPLCNDKRCQTIGVLGSTQIVKPLIDSGIKGVDRVVPIGKTMDFDLIWDGYDLVSQLTRTISIRG